MDKIQITINHSRQQIELQILNTEINTMDIYNEITSALKKLYPLYEILGSDF